MTIAKKIKAHFAERGKIRKRRSALRVLNMRLEVLWEDLMDVDPDSNTAKIIRSRIDQTTAEISALQRFYQGGRQ
jgi:hypothetical protein